MAVRAFRRIAGGCSQQLITRRVVGQVVNPGQVLVRRFASEEELEDTQRGDLEGVGGGLYADSWWPSVSRQVHDSLAQRPQGLPQDPLAQGVMSWIEYELACKPRDPAKKASAGEDSSLPSSTDPEFRPLEKNEEWRWILRSDGELVGPKGRGM